MIIVAIDGPAGAGKSTIAKLLAKKLQFSFLDTGAMYRALTCKAMQSGVVLEDEDALVALAKQTAVELKSEDDLVKVFCDGKDVTQEIRTIEVTNNTFYIARAAGVREVLLDWQRAFGVKENVVAEGRDVGTVVFPQASFKFYLDATVDERASRRIKELREKGQVVDENKLKQEIIERDNKDFTRKVGPLKKAEDAIVIDSTSLSIEEVVEAMFKYVNQK